MNQDGFVTQNGDLLIMSLVGAGIVLLPSYSAIFSVQQQFLLILAFSFLAGLFLDSLTQALEWALFFSLGLLLIALSCDFYENPNAFHLGNIHYFYDLVSFYFQYCSFLLSSWLIGIPLGYGLQKVVMGGYYRQRRTF